MRCPIWQVDAFSDRVFRGNPAAVVVLPRFLDDEALRAAAAENNLSETAFLVREEAGWAIRWFTPTVEVDLCGHATLAAGFVVLERLEPAREGVTFRSPSGPLTVARAGRGRYAVDLPRRPPARMEPPAALLAALRGRAPREAWRARDVVAVLGSEAEVRALAPDLEAVARLDGLGLSVTAPGDDVDFVSRHFAPQAGIPEDPVTGSAHSTLVPYWAARLGRSRLRAVQVSARTGWLECQDLPAEGSVRLTGSAAPWLEGTVEFPGG